MCHAKNHENFVDVFICYKQKYKVALFNLGHTVGI